MIDLQHQTNWQDRLATCGLDIALRVRRFSGHEVVSELVLPSNGEHLDCRVEFGGADLQLKLSLHTPPDRDDVLELRGTATVLHGRATDINLALVLHVSDWSTDNYVLLPGAVYNGNRFACDPQPYPPLAANPDGFKPHPGPTITDIPRLAIGRGTSCIRQTTADTATPAIGVFLKTHKRALWLLTDQAGPWGNHGLGVCEVDDRTRAELDIEQPVVRQQRQGMCRTFSSDDQPATLDAGETLPLEAQLHLLPAADLHAFFDSFAPLRKTRHLRSNRRDQLPFHQAFRIIEDGLNARQWDPEQGYYRVGKGTLYNSDWQLGWTGGGMTTLPLLALGSQLSRQRALNNLDTILTHTQAPSGFFYTSGCNGHWVSDAFRQPHPHNMSLIRKQADALYFLCRQVDLLRRTGHRVPKAWDVALCRLADALVRLWRRHSQFGQFIDIETGDLLVGGSTAGAVAPAGLAMAHALYDRREYLDTARAAAGYYRDNDLARGLTTGGPGDILQAPDSESAFALLESFVVLFETTREDQWIDAACLCADHCATWCVSYDFAFPPNSTFANLGIDTTGSVIANAQNKHAAPGICTLSGDALLKLYRAAGRRRDLELAVDIAHGITQYLSRADRPIPLPDRTRSLAPGEMNERVNMSDWESTSRVGEIFAASCWCTTSCLLTALDLPGVYCRTDTGVLAVFDHVEATAISRQPDHVRLLLHNPTPFDTVVRLCVEDADTCRIPLGPNAMLARPCVTLPAGARRTVTVSTRTPITSTPR